MKKRYLRLAALTAGVLLAAQTGLSAAALSTLMQHTTLHSIRMLQPYAVMTKVRCCVIILTTALTKAASLLRTALPVMTSFL